MTKTLEDLLATGIKAEIEAIEAYSKLAENIKNTILSERFRSLANDESRHQKILEGIYQENFPGKALDLPAQSGVPKVHTTVSAENTLPEILLIAMDAEKKAEEYYKNLAGQMEDQDKKDLLNYLANIESGHHYFLKLEYDLSQK